MDVTLRAVEPTDVDMIYRIESDQSVKRVTWGEAPVSRYMIWNYVQQYSADIYRDRQLRLVVAADGRAVGTIDISDFDAANRRAMIGIAIEDQHRGQGIGSCALSLAIEYARDTLGLHQLAAMVAKSNAESLGLFGKMGFKVCGCLKSWIKTGKKYEDAVIMQLIF